SPRCRCFHPVSCSLLLTSVLGGVVDADDGVDLGLVVGLAAFLASVGGGSDLTCAGVSIVEGGVLQVLGAEGRLLLHGLERELLSGAGVLAVLGVPDELSVAHTGGDAVDG